MQTLTHRSAAFLCLFGGAMLVATVRPRAQDISAKDLRDGFANAARWLTYSGDYSGRRHSPLKEITPANVGQLVPQWTFQTGAVPGKFEATPLVIDGIVYISGPLDHVWAIDAATGRQVWHYQRLLPNGILACCGMVNRGLAVFHDRLYLSTLDAHLVALGVKDGKVLFDVVVEDYLKGYAATGAPLVVNGKVLVGIAGGEYGIRGFIDAYDAESGARTWRFYTVPAPGEKGGDTWQGDSWQHGGGPTWLSGTYDPDLNLVYWGVGNPGPDYDGETREGDNLFTGSLVALDATSGALRWHFQFTPHDVHDWDANQIPVLADLTVAGVRRKTVMVANRNGFFYVLDRATGSFIRGSPYIDTTWAKELDAAGKPRVLPGTAPTAEGTMTCPDLFGATNFMSPSFDPTAQLFLVSARETCATFFRRPQEFKAGERFMSGIQRMESRNFGALRAIDPLTGETKWEYRHKLPSWAGVLTTAGGVAFTGDNDGYALAFDVRTGKPLWRYLIGAPIYAAPTTVLVNGRQIVLLPAGTTLTAFALNPPT
jgi:alcohol dehydrogenase (cytochrome c)